MPETSFSEPRPPRRRLQFGLGTMLLAVLPISILSAAWAGMVGLGADNVSLPPGFFVLMAAATPVALVILISAGRAVLRLAGRSHRRR